MRLSLLTITTLALAHSTTALTISADDSNGIKEAAKTVAYGMMKYYNGNETGMIPGELVNPYYWWECGAMFDSLVRYYHLTGDSTYNEVVTEGMLFQVGPYDNFMVL